MAKNTVPASRFQASALSASRVQFYFLGVYALYIIVSDAWNLITPQLALQRWTMSAIMLSSTVAIWYAARTGGKTITYYKALISLLVLFGLAFASFNVYTQRGMASRAVMFYALPVIISAMLLSRAAIFTTAALSVATYVLAAVRYFVVHPGEGYKVELYAEVSLYCAVFFVVAALLWANLRPKL